MNIKRRKARVVHVGPVAIGGNHPISVQSMTNTDTRDVGATLAQIVELEKAGCEIIRLGIPDMDAAEKFGEIKEPGRCSGLENASDGKFLRQVSCAPFFNR